MVDARIEGALNRAIGHTSDLDSGETTVYMVADTPVTADGRKLPRSR